MAEELMKIENAVEEPAKKATKPQRNYKKELEEANKVIEALTDENTKLHQYVDTLFKQSQDLNNKLTIATNALNPANEALDIVGKAYSMLKNHLASITQYLNGVSKETR